MNKLIFIGFIFLSGCYSNVVEEPEKEVYNGFELHSPSMEPVFQLPKPIESSMIFSDQSNRSNKSHQNKDLLPK